MKIKILKHAEGLPLPEYKTPGSAAFDLAVTTASTIFPGQVAKLATGLCFAIPSGFFGMIKSRSSSNMKGLRIDGVIDSDYRGEVFLAVCNTSTKPVDVVRGDRIAQMILMQSVHSSFEVVDELDETVRGTSGFGSTGR